GKRVLDPLVRRAYESLSRPGRDLSAARRLAKVLLGPVANRLGTQRLVLVTDGLLCYIPFAALPWGAPGHFLLDDHEIVRLPSATILTALRRRSLGRPATTGSP